MSTLLHISADGDIIFLEGERSGYVLVYVDSLKKYFFMYSFFVLSMRYIIYFYHLANMIIASLRYLFLRLSTRVST